MEEVDEGQEEVLGDEAERSLPFGGSAFPIPMA